MNILRRASCAWAALLAAVSAGALRAETFPLNGTWQLAVAPDAAAADAAFAGAHEPDLNADGMFRPMPVPGVWSLHGFEEPRYDRPTHVEGFYRHVFTPPADLQGMRILLHFGGVWQSAEVWLNGRRLGRNDSGFTAFGFDVSAVLRPGVANVLAVRVRQRSPEYLFDCNDDWVFPGIYRDVWLESQPRDLAIDRIEVETDFDEAYRDAVLRLRAFVLRWPQGEKSFTVRATLREAEGRSVVARSDISGKLPGRIFLGATGQDVRLELAVAAPRQWTAETPYLYALAVELLDGDRVVHMREERVGFREVTWSGGVLRVNGRPVKLRGVARHDEHPLVGRATREQHWREDLRLMREANINAIRTAHYPPAEGFLKLCDEMGFYVIDEIPFGKADELLHDPAFAGAALARARATLARDRNRPSIIVWSVGNEDPLTAAHVDVLRAVKGLDPTRPTLLPYRYDGELPLEVDLAAPHYLSVSEYRKLAERSDRPILSTEYNHGLGGHDFGDLAPRWAVMREHDRFAGGCIWLWADQAVRRPVAGRRVLDPLLDYGKYVDDSSDLIRHSDAGSGHIWDAHGASGADGIVNPDRSPQRDYWETRAVYAPVRIVRHEWAAGKVRVTLRNDHDFISLAGFAAEWIARDEKRELARGAVALSAAAGAEEVFGAEVPPESVFLQLRFVRPDESELAAVAVELQPATQRVRRSEEPARLSRTPSGAEFATAGMRFNFDPASGRFTVRGRDEELLVSDLKPTLWRTPSLAELHYFRKFNKGAPDPVNLNQFERRVIRWNATDDRTRPQLEAEIEYHVDDRNAYTCVFRIEANGAGQLQVSYELRARVQSPWLPHGGIALSVPKSEGALRWRGLGPVETYPNQRAAARPGVWEETAPSGVRDRVDWVELHGGLRAEEMGAFEWSAAATELRLLAKVQARFTKNRAPDEASQMIDPQHPVKGSFVLRVNSSSVAPRR